MALHGLSLLSFACMPDLVRFSVVVADAPSSVWSVVRVCGALLLLWSVVPYPGAAQQADVFDQRVGAEVDADTVEARRFDDGRMWTFENPPLDDFEERYGFRPTQRWLDRARLGALRIPGCSASFVSSAGLVLTNHHCARSHATAVQRDGEALGENGFYAGTTDQERPVPGMYADQLIAIEDVTASIDSALAAAQTDAERADRRQTAIDSIEQRLRAAHDDTDNVRVDVTPLYNGARHSAYVYRRYTDVRLVFVPEHALGYFGGDADNFTYPRYALDMAFFRVYNDNGTPLTPAHHFQWDVSGAEADEPVFVVGNPGSTLRLETHDQLAFRRDVQDVHTLRYFERRAEALGAYLNATDDTPPELEDEFFLMQNVVKLYTGRVEALNDAYIMTRIEKGDAELQSLIQDDDALREYRGVIDSMAAVQEQKREWAADVRAFYRIGAPRFGSATLARAWAAHTYGQRQQAGAPDSLLTGLRSRVQQVPSQPDALDRRFLTARLQEMANAFSADSAFVRQILNGQSPADRAASLVDASVFSDSTAAEAVAAAPPPDDPAASLVAALYDRYQQYQSAWNGLQARQQEIARTLGQARYAAYGTRVPPDATFTLRLADGRVKSYNYNGTMAPAHTTYYGLYGHYHSYGTGSEWTLPKRWQTPPEEFHRATPVNMVSTNDITGGNSGSPVLNEDLELVGLAFDGNIESLAGDYIYLPGRMRTVSVDVRGMLEALDDIYDADRLVQEVIGGSFVERESAASESAYAVPR